MHKCFAKEKVNKKKPFFVYKVIFGSESISVLVRKYYHHLISPQKAWRTRIIIKKVF